MKKPLGDTFYTMTPDEQGVLFASIGFRGILIDNIIEIEIRMEEAITAFFIRRDQTDRDKQVWAVLEFYLYSQAFFTTVQKVYLLKKIMEFVKPEWSFKSKNTKGILHEYFTLLVKLVELRNKAAHSPAHIHSEQGVVKLVKSTSYIHADGNGNSPVYKALYEHDALEITSKHQEDINTQIDSALSFLIQCKTIIIDENQSHFIAPIDDWATRKVGVYAVIPS